MRTPVVAATVDPMTISPLVAAMRTPLGVRAACAWLTPAPTSPSMASRQSNTSVLPVCLMAGSSTPAFVDDFIVDSSFPERCGDRGRHQPTRGRTPRHRTPLALQTRLLTRDWYGPFPAGAVPSHHASQGYPTTGCCHIGSGPYVGRSSSLCWNHQQAKEATRARWSLRPCRLLRGWSKTCYTRVIRLACSCRGEEHPGVPLALAAHL